jgi:hypothetical protein
LINIYIFLGDEKAAKQLKFQKEFAALNEHFTRERQDWLKMSGDFRVNIKRKFEKLNDAQEQFFFDLVDLFIGFVEQHLGLANFSRLDVQWSWNCTIWMDWFVGETFDRDSCVFVDIKNVKCSI